MTLQSYTVVDVALGTPDPPGLDRSVRMYVADEVDALILALQGEKLGAENKLRAMAALVDGRQVEVREEPSLLLTGAQVNALHNFTDGDSEFGVVIQYLPERTACNGDHMPAGLYCWSEDYPDEGVLCLDELPPAVNHEFEGCP